MIIQTIILIFSQIDSNKIQSRPPTGDIFFTFLLLLKYKTDFPLIIIYHNVSQLRSVQSFVAMYLQRFPITYVLRTVQGLHGYGLVRAGWRPVDCLDRTRMKDNWTKHQMAVFLSATREGIKFSDSKHLAVPRNCIYGLHSIRSMWFFSGRCITNHRACI